jgi:outer membrane protein TolC
MKKLFIIWLIGLAIQGQAQITDYNKIILPDKISPISFEERLVQLAWQNHPSNKVLTQTVQALNKEKKLAAYSWLDNFMFVANANQFTLNPETDILNRSAFYPRYNLSLRLSLGTFFLTPIETKLANDDLIVGKYKVDEKKISVRSNVLTGVEQLKQGYKILRLRVRLKEDFLLMYKKSEKSFSLGEVSIDQYRQASQAYYGRAEAEINAQSEFNQNKIYLEQLIGVQLEDVEGYSDFLIKLNQEINID